VGRRCDRGGEVWFYRRGLCGLGGFVEVVQEFSRLRAKGWLG